MASTGLTTLEARYALINQVYQEHLEAHSDLPQRWLLAQTLVTGQTRRGVLNILPLIEGSRVLDIGTGFGALAADLAAHTPLSIAAMDLDAQVLTVADQMAVRMSEIGAFCPSSEIEFLTGDVYEIPFASETFDFIIARFVFQHLHNPTGAMTEIRRVLKPGGMVCIIDIDDGLTITYPETDSGFRRLQDAFIQLQERRGGDRTVGRKLANYMFDSGLTVVGTIIQPQAQFASVSAEDIGVQLTVARFNEVKDDIVRAGLLTSDEFDTLLRDYQQEAQSWQYHATGQMITVGRRPE